VVKLDERGLWVNHVLLEDSAPRQFDSLGRRLEPFFIEDHTVEANTFWVISTYNPNSFDSRYFGPIHRNQIHGKARILF